LLGTVEAGSAVYTDWYQLHALSVIHSKPLAVLMLC